ncbi:hypothetical protein D9M70_593410 [compost metagenome]
MLIHRGQLLLLGQADNHRQRKVVELAGTGVAPHPVPSVDREHGLGVFGVWHHGAVIDRIAGQYRFPGAPYAEDAVGAKEPERTLVAEFRGVVAADEIGGIDLDPGDPGKPAIGRVESPAEAQAPFPGDWAFPRVADGQ